SGPAPARHSTLSCFFLTAPPAPVTSPLSLHDALPISHPDQRLDRPADDVVPPHHRGDRAADPARADHGAVRLGGAVQRRRRFTKSEEHTSELQSRENLVCRLLLEKKKNKHRRDTDVRQ